MTHDISGRPTHEPFAFYDPDSRSVRTSQDTFLSDSTPCSPTLPKWGCMFGGALYELPTPGLLTSGHASSGLPTPTSTTLAGTGRDAAEIERRRKAGDYVTLPDAISLLPTPAVNDMGAGKTPEAWDEWTDRMREAHGNGNGHGRSLSIEAQRLLPTPSASDSTGGDNEEARGGAPGLRAVNHLLPTPRSQNGEARNSKTWVRPLDQPQNIENALARLPGASTSPQSDDGNTSSDEQPPGQLTIEDA